MIARRGLIFGSLGFVPATAFGQIARRRRVAVIRLGAPPPEGDIQVAGVTAAFAELGYLEGRNLIIDNRFAEGAPDRLSAIVQASIADGAEALVAVGAVAVVAARAVTSTIPIVAFVNVDPIAGGLVDNLGRPSGNVTGVLIAPEGSLAAKRLSLLQEAVPSATRFSLLAPTGEPSFDLQIRETQSAAVAAGVNLFVVRVRARHYAEAFAEIASFGTQALIVGAHQFFARDRSIIIGLTERHGLPAIYEWPHQVRDGGLMSFGADLMERYRRLAVYVDRIFKGARPADLPFEQPSVLRLAINLGAARSVGLEFPAALLARADDVIE